ncbi:osteoclast stimulatory transmembrane protein-like [Scyliorhinus canicula]|uniref:osteoclast stimulatory transmembrane protein-like n=1 Tax=Scyliorhinus canicula TaxID=7830 RepID=UPI0018F3A32F|nr:osteoclast stimulatory transmembrane protein-like [Scyliorhinus canicula]XP_038659514.1 osteoclast stimulatory transmembrane protein-like [Scyliorhinus canicula]
MSACLNVASSLRTGVQHQLSYVWSVYSKPTPCNIKELFILFLFCLSIAGATGGLLYQWLSNTLQYKEDPSGIVAGTFASIVLLLLFLVHPARCAFTLIIPTLVTKQGRKLLLSGICLLLGTNVIPNIVRNIKMLLELSQCILRSATDNILNSTQLVSQAMSALELGGIDKVIKMLHLQLNYHPDINYAHIRSTLTNVSQQINGEFQSVQVWMDRATLLTNRAFATILILNLIVASIWYLAHYLTDLDFDNNYLTRKLEKLCKSSSANCDVFLSMAGKLTKTTGLKLSQKEKRKCLIRLIMVTIYLVLSAAVIAADYGIFHLTSSLTQWTENAPCLTANLDLTFVIEMDIPGISDMEKFKDNTLGFFGVNTNVKVIKPIVDINKKLSWCYDLIPIDCVKKPVRPDLQVICFVGGMYIVTYFMAALDAYAVRVRRRIAASFFQNQEEERISYLYQKILTKCGKGSNRQYVISAGPSEGGSWERGCAEHGGVSRISQRWRGNERTQEQPASEPATLAMASYRTAEAPHWEMQDSEEEETNF